MVNFHGLVFRAFKLLKDDIEILNSGLNITFFLLS
jgi:hypothetical protein